VSIIKVVVKIDGEDLSLAEVIDDLETRLGCNGWEVGEPEDGLDGWEIEGVHKFSECDCDNECELDFEDDRDGRCN
jgi:hypothetical protein